MKKEKKLWKKLGILNPRNLEKEVHIYGYHFSWKTHALLMLGSLLGIGAVGIVFHLEPVYFTIVAAAVIVTLPFLVLAMYQRMYEQKRFSDAVTYMEQVLYAFQKTKKALSALKETREIFPPGQMRETLDGAITYLENGYAKTEKGVLREALEIIEGAYSCLKIQTVHELLASSEEYGGEIENSIFLLLEDLEIYKRRGYELQAEKKTSHADNIISIVVSTVLCAVALYVLDAMGRLFPEAALDVTIFQAPLIQASSLVFILVMLFILVKSFNKLAVNWLKESGMYRRDYILDSYRKVVAYDAKKERRKSLLLAVPFFAAAVLLFLFYRKWMAVPCALIAVFLLFQHRIGYNIASKDVTQELYLTLPQWLMNMALLLQNNNVQVSIAKSINGAPEVLREELYRLTERLEEAPDQLSSYTEFCSRFDVPETQSCMKMLHAIAESGTGSAKTQIHNLLHRVSEMQNVTDRIQDENIAFKMKMIFSYPVMAATVKLLADMTYGMVFVFQMLANMGGM